MNADTLRQLGYIETAPGEWTRTPRIQLDRVSQPSQHESDSRHDAVATDTRTDDLPGFRIVRITSCRLRLCDDRNIFDKYLVDALVKAQCLRDDSPQWCKVEVFQRTVLCKADECTVIEISEPL